MLSFRRRVLYPAELLRLMRDSLYILSDFGASVKGKGIEIGNGTQTVPNGHI